MADITPTIAIVRGQNGMDGWQVKWGPMANGDVGLPVGSTIGDGAAAVAPGGGVTFAGFADKSIAVTGTFGAAGSISLEGSNDGGANYFILNDVTGTAPLTFSAANLKAVTEAVIWCRPHVTNGDGTTALNVSMFFRKTQEP